jgi:hypothetical protein
VEIAIEQDGQAALDFIAGEHTESAMSQIVQLQK